MTPDELEQQIAAIRSEIASMGDDMNKRTQELAEQLEMLCLTQATLATNMAAQESRIRQVEGRRKRMDGGDESKN